MTTATVTTWADRVSTTVQQAGSGDHVLFLHGETGLQWTPFLDRLAESFTVLAPAHPGTDGEHHDAIRAIDTLWDLVVYYAELLDTLGAGRVAIVGHSFGGMVACEFAAAYPERVSRLVLLNPLGLWREDAPIANWMAMDQRAVIQATFHDPGGPLATMFGSLVENLGEHPELAANFMWSLACTGKFLWPIPDRGLHKRIHRISAPTLVLWGASDGIVPPSYAHEFARLIPGTRVEIIDEAGHLPHLEQLDRTAQLVTDFLGP